MKPYSEYIDDPLDEEYRIIPGNEVEKGSLPQEDIEISQALAALKIIHLQASDLNFLSRTFKTKAYLDWENKFNSQKKRTKDLIFSSNEYRAAYHRLVNSIPKDVYNYDKDFWNLLERVENAQ
ncbi:TPA: hypothetical protein MDW71_005285 [Klebsiella pneumoniae]|nr:hypothetical protein [Klebsiella pneumoniae]